MFRILSHMKLKSSQLIWHDSECHVRFSQACYQVQNLKPYSFFPFFLFISFFFLQNAHKRLTQQHLSNLWNCLLLSAGCAFHVRDMYCQEISGRMRESSDPCQCFSRRRAGICVWRAAFSSGCPTPGLTEWTRAVLHSHLSSAQSSWTSPLASAHACAVLYIHSLME